MLLFFTKLGQAVYRIWFYTLVALPIVIFLPFLFIATISERTYQQFYWLARNLWAKPILFGMGLWPKIKWQQRMKNNKSYMLVANHTSMIDIMLMLYVSKNPFVFVGKKELKKIPLFGFFYKRVCILVDRDNLKSRVEVYKQVQHRLNQNLSICIFPEGGIPEKEVFLGKFKDGAFRIAITHKIPVIPIVFLDCKEHFPWEFFSGYPGTLAVQVENFKETAILETEDIRMLREEVRNSIYNTLKEKGIQS